jgi:hypothetical protein
MPDHSHLLKKALVTHICNPTYSGGKSQEDRVSKPAQASSSRDPILKKTHHDKRAGGVAQGEGPEFKPQYYNKQTNKQKESAMARHRGLRL